MSVAARARCSGELPRSEQLDTSAPRCKAKEDHQGTPAHHAPLAHFERHCLQRGMVMILGLDGYTLVHVAISLIGIGAGFIVLGGFLADARLDGAVHTYFAMAVATDVTGFLFPFNGFLPSYAVGIISLIGLAIAIYAYYAARLAGPWRSVFVISIVATLYLDVFVLIAQTFQKNPALLALAPTQSEMPFLVVQAAALVTFVVLGALSLSRFRDMPS